jgi:hypothetical protein
MCGRIIIIIIVKKKRRISIRIIIIIIRNGAKTRSSQNFVWGLNNKKRCKNNKSPNFVWGLNKKRSKHNMSPKLSLGAIINGLYPSYPTSVSYDHSLALLLYCSFYVILPVCDSLWSFGVETNLCRICIDCLG